MRKPLWSFLLLLFLVTTAYGQPPDAAIIGPGKPVVRMETTMGDIYIELDPDRAPISVSNFLDYVTSGFYDGTVIHRVVPQFVIQGGGFTPELKEKEAGPAIANEAGNGLKNRRGTIAVARPIDIDSGTSQFFINVGDNRILDHKDDTVQGYGYAVFGRVIRGMNVVDRINRVETMKVKNMKNVPVEPIIVKSATVVNEQ